MLLVMALTLFKGQLCILAHMQVCVIGYLWMWVFPAFCVMIKTKERKK